MEAKVILFQLSKLIAMASYDRLKTPVDFENYRNEPFCAVLSNTKTVQLCKMNFEPE